jgi:hypothetical protein
MTDRSEQPDDIDPPSVDTWMLSFLSVRRSEYEEQFIKEAPDDEAAVEHAIDRLERFAIALVTSGVVPADLQEMLGHFKPGDSMATKVRELLTYRIVHHRLEFDVAEDVSARLEGVDKRVSLATVLTIILLGYRPSDTAVKYFQRATTLYLAGYEAETIVMCGAVLEAALRARFSDDEIEAAGIQPIFKRTGDYSIAQRLKFEEGHPIFNEDQRRQVSNLLSWRNDAVHVQPDIGPKSENALISLAVLLPTIFPEEQF